jgi:uncharacterized membrane protein YfcA
MSELGQLSPMAWHAVLFAARSRRTADLRVVLGRLRFRRSDTGIFLIWMGVLGVMFVIHHNSHLEVIMISVGLASLVSSIAGFAFSAICGAMLFHLSDNPVQVVQIMSICSIANQAAMTWSSRREIRWRELSIYLGGGLFGLVAGVWLLLHADRARYAPLLGMFLLSYGGYMFLRKPVVIRSQYAALDFVAGTLGGITGGAAGFPGAFVTIWCGMKGWEKPRQRAVFQPFILIMQVFTLLSISFVRHQSAGGLGFDPTNLLFIPASLLGTWGGLALYRRLSDGQFARAINILLIISGFSYIV